MKILVFVKQVPDTDDVKLDPKTGNIMREGVASKLNPLDANAVEAAIRLKEKYGAQVCAISMGPPQAEDVLKKALAPSEDFNCSQLAAAASRGEEDLLKFLSGNGFGGASEALGKSLSAFECWCDNQQIEAIKPQKRVITSIGPVVAYYLARENEIRTVRIILTAKANGFSEDSIRERVREMYV